MDKTDSRTDTEPVSETAQQCDAERDHFRYLLWSQASQDWRPRRTGVERYSAMRRNGEARDLNGAALQPQKPTPETVSAADALTGARKPR
jgi:hypothetical protein